MYNTAMIKDAGNLAKGMYVLYRGAPNLIVKTEFMNPGKGSAIMRVKYKNPETGAASEFTYKTSDRVEIVEVEKKVMQFLYADPSEAFFMDPKTYDQVSVKASLMEGQTEYLLPNMECYILFYQNRAIGVLIPPHVRLKVIEAGEAVAGSTVNGAKKTVKLETGIEVAVPLFIKSGETILVDTVTGEYLSRAN